MLFHISTVVLNPPWTTIFEANTPWKWKKRVYIALNQHHVNAKKCLSDIPLNRKLKFQTDEHSNLGRKKVHPGDLNLDDYHPIDPVPSSKTSVKPGPIEHSAPLLPHMPNPPPPNQPGGYA
ncbi:hypothetical protein IC582_015464 [Cucumis melo]